MPYSQVLLRAARLVVLDSVLLGLLALLDDPLALLQDLPLVLIDSRVGIADRLTLFPNAATFCLEPLAVLLGPQGAQAETTAHDCRLWR